MKTIALFSLLLAVCLIVGCQESNVSAEKHRSINLQQEITTESAIRESQAMDQTPENIDSGPKEVHRETIVEKVESEEVVIN